MSKDRGSMAVETVILTPIFVLLLVFLSYASRVVAAQHELNRSADGAARAASQAQQTSINRKGREMAYSLMSENKSHCQNFAVQVFRIPISGVMHVEVRTSCRVNVSGLSLLGVRSPALTASSTEVVDVYRHP